MARGLRSIGINKIIPAQIDFTLPIAGSVKINENLTLQQSATPTVDSGQGKLYVKSDGKLYFKSSTTSETDLTATESSTTSTLIEQGTTPSAPAAGFTRIWSDPAGALYVQINGEPAGERITKRPQSVVSSHGTSVSTGGKQLLQRSRGTRASPTIVQSGDTVGEISFQQYDGTAYRNSAQILSNVDGTPAANDCPGSLLFTTTPDGSTSPQSRMMIKSTGKIGIGTITPSNTLEIRNTGADGDDGVLVVNSSTSVSDGELLGGIGFDSNTGNIPSRITEASGFIAVYAAEAHSISDKGGTLIIGTATVNQDDDTASSANIKIRNRTVEINASATDTAADGLSGFTVLGRSGISNDGISIDNHHNSANTSGFLRFRKSIGGSRGSEASVADNQVLGMVEFQGWNDTYGNWNNSARIEARVDGTPANSNFDMPGKLYFSTSADGVATPFVRMAILSNGNVGIGTAAPEGPLHVDSASQTNIFIGESSGPNTTGPVVKLVKKSFDGAQAEAAEDNELLGSMEFYGTVDTNQTAVRSSAVSGYADGAPNGSNLPGRLEFRTCTNSSQFPTTRMTIDSSGLVYMANHLGIGNSVPTHRLDVLRTDASSLARLEYRRDDAFGPVLTFQKSGYNGGAQSKVDENDELGRISFRGTDNNTGGVHEGASIRSYVDGEVASGDPVDTSDMPGRLEFLTTLNGSTTSTTRMTIKNNGQVGIGTSTFNGQLAVGSYIGNSIVTTGRVGVGTAIQDIYNVGTGVVHVADLTQPTFVAEGGADNIFSGVLLFRKARGGDLSAKTGVNAGDNLGAIHFQGWNDNNTAAYDLGAVIQACVDGDPHSSTDTSDMPTRLEFKTSADGESSPTVEMVIKSDGKVGIGTESPVNTLSVDGNSMIQRYGGNDFNYPELRFRKAQGTEASPTIVTDGEVLGTIRFQAYDDAGFHVTSRIQAQIVGTPAADTLPTALTFRTSEGSTDSERMRILPDGKVGIGTETPGYALEVLGEVYASDWVGAGNYFYVGSEIRHTGDIDNKIAFGTDTQTFYTSNTARVSIISDGKVGIGVTDPDQKLEVAGSIHISGEVSTPSAPADGDGGILYVKTNGKLYWRSHEQAEIELTGFTSNTGDITGVTAGSGLSGGGSSGGVTLNIGEGTGISVAANSISVDVSDFMTNGSNNRVLTATGADSMNAESALTFDGTTLQVSADSGANTEQILLYESEDGYARLSFANSCDTSGEGGDYSHRYTIAAKPATAGNAGSARLNIYYEDYGDIATFKGDGRVGIGTTSPDCGLHVRDSVAVTNQSTSVFQNPLPVCLIESVGANSKKHVILDLLINEDTAESSGNGEDFFIRGFDNGGGNVDTGGDEEFHIDGDGNLSNTFTGQHICVYHASADISNLDDEITPGMIVESTGIVGIERGATGIDDCVPIIKISSQKNSKKVYGVLSGNKVKKAMAHFRYFSGSFHPSDRREELFDVSGSYNYERDSHTYSDNSRYFKSKCNSIGEGKIWVTNIYGDINNGDYITTSEVPGYGGLQEDDLLHNYTTAKCTQDIDWDNIIETVDYDNKTYKKILVACTYHCG